MKAPVNLLCPWHPAMMGVGRWTQLGSNVHLSPGRHSIFSRNIWELRDSTGERHWTCTRPTQVQIQHYYGLQSPTKSEHCQVWPRPPLPSNINYERKKKKHLELAEYSWGDCLKWGLSQ